VDPATALRFAQDDGFFHDAPTLSSCAQPQDPRRPIRFLGSASCDFAQDDGRPM